MPWAFDVRITKQHSKRKEAPKEIQIPLPPQVVYLIGGTSISTWTTGKRNKRTKHKATKQTRQERKVAREVQVSPPHPQVVHVIGGTSLSTYNQPGKQSTTNTQQTKQNNTKNQSTEGRQDNDNI